MKMSLILTLFSLSSLLSPRLDAQTKAQDPAQNPKQKSTRNLYIDVHHVGPGKVKVEDVAKAHAKDVAVQKKYGTKFIKYWVDEAEGNIYCLVSSPDTQSIVRTHAEAHGLLPDRVYEVTGGKKASLTGDDGLFLDVHNLGPGKVNAKAVAGAHEKDLAVQKKYGVNLINYWVDEKEGIVMCLAQAKDSASLVNTHREAHGLIPVTVESVKQGN